MIRKFIISKVYDSSTCRCGCGGKALYLCSGKDYGGETFVDEPACFDATVYLEESAALLGLPFSKQPIAKS